MKSAKLKSNEQKATATLKMPVNLENIRLAQAKNNAAAYNFSVGLPINFDAANLRHKKYFI